MACNKHIWGHCIYLFYYGTVVVTWITSYMLKKDVCIFTLETQNLRITNAQISTITISTNCTKNRSQSLKAIGNFSRSDVSCMPYFITLRKIILIFRVPKSMRITNNSYSFHRFSFRLINSAMNFSVSLKPK